MKIRNVYTSFDNVFHLISEIFLSFIKRLSPFITAFFPGFLFWFTIYTFVLNLTGNPYLASFVGLSGAVTMESAGIWSGHKIAEYLGDDDFSWEIIIPIITLLLYMIIGIGVLWFLDSLSNDLQIVGTAIFLLAGVIYILFGLQSYKDRNRAKKDREEKAKVNEEKEEKQEALAYRRQQNEEKKKFERELKLKELELAHEEKMAMVEQPAIVERKEAPEKKRTRYDQAKMQRLINFLKLKPDALETFTKTELAEKLQLTRPTLDKYIKIYEEEILA